MHFHYYSLQHFANFLNQHHVGEHFLRCFSQNKNELVIELENVHLRVGCNTPMTYVVPAHEFAMARKNVVGLFPEIKGEVFLKARVVPWERVLILEGEDGFSLVLKMHGMRANVLMRRAEKVTAVFNKDQEKDLEYVEEQGPYDKAVWDELAACNAPMELKEVQHALRKLSPIYDRLFATRSLAHLEKGLNLKQSLEACIAEAEDQHFYLCRLPDRIRLFLFPPAAGSDCLKLTGIDTALPAYIAAQFQYSGYRRLYREIFKKLEKPYQKFQKVHASYLQSIHKLETERNPEEIGHLLMANLHAIATGEKKVELDDFYTGGKIEVKLKEELSPQDNAARYYDKHKQRKAKVRYLKSQLEDIEQKLSEAEAGVEAFRRFPKPEDLPFEGQGFDARELRALKKDLKVLVAEQEEEERDRLPFRTFHKENFEIFVGRNAKNNDLLSFKFANKEDIWLHAKDVVGSHVIIRRRPGKQLPVTVLEYAAGLAAFYSKRKNDSLVPVQYTPRKYIRKRKGDPAGFVVVSREEVVMVEPIKG